MGNTETKQRLGERVNVARKKLETSKKQELIRLEAIKQASSNVTADIVDSIAKSFKNYSPFSEEILLTAWFANKKKCETILIDSTQKLLKQPINRKEFEWFNLYVMNSSVWFMKATDNRYMFSHLMDIARTQSLSILKQMNKIYASLRYMDGWKDLIAIKHQSLVDRQDHDKVGLLKNKSILDFKTFLSEQKDEKQEQLENFMDSKLAINMLLATAGQINDEFQQYTKRVLCEYGKFAEGPIKKLERCQSKLENDYYSEDYPKAAKLLDIVRCSVTFNTIEDMMAAYQHLMKHIARNKSMIEVARIKNGFLDADYKGGYRDLKVNVIYHSQTNIKNNVSMVVEIQFILVNYLWEKKKLHRLYSIRRNESFFKMVVTDENEKKIDGPTVDINNLKLSKVFDLSEHGGSDITDCAFKSRVYPEIGLLLMEDTWTRNKLYGYDLKSKKLVFEHKVAGTGHTHHLINFKNSKYLMFQVAADNVVWNRLYASKDNAIDTKLIFFKVGPNHEFTLDPSMEIDVKGEISYVEFDKNYKHVYILSKYQILTKRLMSDVNNVIMTIKLKKKVEYLVYKQMSLSNDGQFCAIASGWAGSKDVYLINIDQQTVTTIVANALTSTYSPTWINGENELLAVGDNGGRVEILDIKTKSSLKVIKVLPSLISAMHSVNNILAVAGYNHKVKLYNVKDWKVVYEEKHGMDEINAMYLSSNAKYLSIGGYNGEVLIVFTVE